MPGLWRSRPLGPAMSAWLGTLGRRSRGGWGGGRRLAQGRFAGWLTGRLGSFSFLPGSVSAYRIRV